MISKEALARIYDYHSEPVFDSDGTTFENMFEKECYAIQKDLDRLEQLEKELKDGTLSDGYHTFNDLYLQRMYLFATIVNQNKELAWKSLKHEDGELCFGGDWFIVGIETPKGSYTYHYENKYWDLFQCVELEVAKHWDGHTSKDVDRLLSLNILFKNNESIVRDNVKLMNKNLELQKENKELQQINEEFLQSQIKAVEKIEKLEKALDILKEKLDIKLEVYHNGGCTLNHKIISNCVIPNERCLRYLEVEEFKLLKEMLEEA